MHAGLGLREQEKIAEPDSQGHCFDLLNGDYFLLRMNLWNIRHASSPFLIFHKFAFLAPTPYLSHTRAIFTVPPMATPRTLPGQFESLCAITQHSLTHV